MRHAELIAANDLGLSARQGDIVQC
ncbi:MAG: hypothetical protein QOH87_2408, partial [Trebonia sp.]|nr:hypothetical protein [Trebonia sp.]